MPSFMKASIVYFHYVHEMQQEYSEEAMRISQRNASVILLDGASPQRVFYFETGVSITVHLPSKFLNMNFDIATILNKFSDGVLNVSN